MLDYVTLWALLAIVAVAVAASERRSRRVLVAAGAPWPATQRAAARPLAGLARVEAARLARHPLVWVGLAGTAASIAGAVPAFSRPSVQLLSLNAFPLAIGLFAATHLAVGRDRRAGMAELARTLPVGTRSRTLAHLLAAAVVTVPLGVAAIAATWAALGADRTLEGARILPGTPPDAVMAWTPGALELAQPAAVVVLAGILAVAAGRWWPHPVAAFLVALLLFSPMGWNAHAVPLHLPAGPRWQATADGGGVLLGHVTTAMLTWHLVFVAGYALLGAAGALARHDRRPAALVAVGLGVATMVAGFVVKVPSFAWLA